MAFSRVIFDLTHLRKQGLAEIFYGKIWSSLGNIDGLDYEFDFFDREHVIVGLSRFDYNYSQNTLHFGLNSTIAK